MTAEIPTPRTDEQVNILIPRVTNQGCVPAKFARTLERDLAQAVELLAEARQLFDRGGEITQEVNNFWFRVDRILRLHNEVQMTCPECGAPGYTEHSQSAASPYLAREVLRLRDEARNPKGGK